MEDTQRNENNSLITEKETKHELDNDFFDRHELDNDCHDDDLLIASLPKEKGWLGLEDHFYQGFWCPDIVIRGVMSVQQHFKAQDTDLILITMPKSGTTWLKALAFAIANRHDYPNTLSQHPLLTSNPHKLIPFLEFNSNKEGCHIRSLPIVSNFQSPTANIFSTHIPYHSLPDSIKNSGCRVVYLCRNPYDVFVSTWHFVNKARAESLGPLSCDDAFDMFCRGVMGFGPFWDHALGHWKESLERPHKVLFLMYEDLKEEITLQIKRLAEFMGVPFSLEEERKGVIEETSKLCSFNNLRELEVNKSGSLLLFENKTFFRRGEVGDWVNHLTPEMVQRLNKIMEEKLDNSGLVFKTSL
ncbi:cytosolic sulfotransferase 15-like isoform X1 [Camellia sinensis]|uniref:cytosolic sulfotransferase 15-like isoform X1 n=1 Tax=Camellia sinensis TaxID=4442 RepID=UPI0010358FF6|nr:cytosolic sulfotransferase 15-like isoform X1 [Camellia sinensis]